MANEPISIDPQDLFNSIVAQRDAVMNENAQLKAAITKLQRELAQATAMKGPTPEVKEAPKSAPPNTKKSAPAPVQGNGSHPTPSNNSGR